MYPGLVDVHTHLAYGNAKSEEDIGLYSRSNSAPCAACSSPGRSSPRALRRFARRAMPGRSACSRRVRRSESQTRKDSLNRRLSCAALRVRIPFAPPVSLILTRADVARISVPIPLAVSVLPCPLSGGLPSAALARGRGMQTHGPPVAKERSAFRAARSSIIRRCASNIRLSAGSGSASDWAACSRASLSVILLTPRISRCGINPRSSPSDCPPAPASGRSDRCRLRPAARSHRPLQAPNSAPIACHRRKG